MSEKSDPKLETRLVHGEDFTDAWNFRNHLVPPITSNSTYRLKSFERGAKGFAEYGQEGTDAPIWIYDRLAEPNTLMLEEQLTFLEQGESAVTFGSGMGAISSLVLSLASKGDEIVSDSTIYGCTHSLFSNWLPKYGITTNWQDLSQLDSLDSISESTRIVYLESVANPTLKICPLDKIIERVNELNKTREKKIFVVVDNTFATPLGFKPISKGADFVVHSLTKNIAGFGTELGGVVVCSSKEWNSTLLLARKDFGAVLNSKSAWQILTHGIPTLKLRFEQQQKSAKEVANFLFNHSKVEQLLYPGHESFPDNENFHRLFSDSSGKTNSGFMISFTLEGSMEETIDFVNSIAKDSYTITLAVSLGVIKTLIEVPRLMTHSALDEEASEQGRVNSKLIRLSIGVENSKDIIADLDTALRKLP